MYTEEKVTKEELIKASIEYDKLLEIEREIKTNLNDCLTSYSFGAKTKEDVEKQINYYVKKYDFFTDGDKYINKLNKMAASKEKSKRNSKIPNKWIYVIVAAFLIVILVLLVPQFSKSSQMQRNEQMPEAHYHKKENKEQYTTYYQDENGNGKFDKGEWNWTEDGNGNTVDIDNDGSNF